MYINSDTVWKSNMKAMSHLQTVLITLIWLKAMHCIPWHDNKRSCVEIKDLDEVDGVISPVGA
jgi:hypothetical protein